MRLLILIISLLSVGLHAAEPPKSRTYTTSTPPTAQMPHDPNAKTTYRIYRKIDDPNESENGDLREAAAREPYRYFVGVGAQIVKRDRKITIASYNNKDKIDIGGDLYPANGRTYHYAKRENGAAALLEAGFVSTQPYYYGLRFSLFDDFATLGATVGASFERVSIAAFTPFVEIGGGVGYENLDGAKPDHLTVGIEAGLEKTVVGDYLLLRLSALYNYRYWQTLEEHYGNEYWRDHELGASLRLRYLF